MKKIYYLPLFLLIIATSFFLLKSKKIKTDRIIFVEKKANMESRDTIKLVELIDHKWEEYFVGFNERLTRNEAYFLGDTVDIRLNAGLLGGYNLTIKMIGEEFTSKLTQYSCTWHEDLIVQEQELILENFERVHGKILKGEVYCKAKYKKLNHPVEMVKISGYFEMDLVDANRIPYIK